MANSTVSRIELAVAKKPIPTCSPNLMPFHIQYSGPAPISTYFRVRPSVDPVSATGSILDASKDTPRPAAERTATSDSQETLVPERPSLDPSSSSSSVATLVAQGQTSASYNATTHDGKQFVASFRGRAVRGTKVDLPPGFSGVVLSAPDAALKKAPASAKVEEEGQRRTRPKRAASKKQAMQFDEAEEADDSMEGVEEEVLPVRVLEPTGTFSSFTLWHPDIPVDEGRDEYLRSLTEWTAIAAEVHYYED